jgi:hypothetical protein
VYTSRGSRYPSIRRYVLLLAVLAAALGVGASVALAAPPKPYSAQISPTTASGGSTASYTYTITNLSSQELGSANVTIPTGWSNVSITSVCAAPSGASCGKVWNVVDTTPTDGDLLGVDRIIELRNNGPASTQRLASGQSVVVKFTATAPCTPLSGDWTPTVKQANNFSGSGNDFFKQSGVTTVTINAGCPDHLTIVEPIADTVAGSQMAGSPPGAIQVRVEDAANNLVDDDGRNISLSVAGATLSGTTTVQTLNGVAAFTGLSMTKAGTQTLSASASPSLTGDTASLTILPAPPDHLAFSVQPSGTPALEAISPAVQVEIQDQYGNGVTQAAGQRDITIALGTNPGPGVLGGTTTVTSSGGLATFSNLTISKKGDGYTLQATSSSPALPHPTAVSDAFDVGPGLPAALVVDSVVGTTPGPEVERRNPTVPSDNDAFNVTVHVVDAAGDTTTVPAGRSVSVTLSRAQGTGNLGGTTTGAISAGQSSTTITGVTYSVAQQGVVIHASGTLSPSTTLTADDSNPFEVFEEVTKALLSPGQAAQLDTSGDANACDTDTQNLVCVTVFLANGASTTQFVTLQEGTCPAGQICLGSALAGLIGDFKDAFGNPLYSATAPVRLVIEYDKSITRNRSPNDIVMESSTDGVNFHVLGNCTTPGIVSPPPVHDCVDRSYRDGSADTIKELILFDDYLTRGK